MYQSLYAKKHAELGQIRHKMSPTIKSSDIYYRPLQSHWEVEELRLLDKELFPDLPYPPEFFNTLLYNRYTVTILALYDVEHQSQRQTIILGCIIFEFSPINPKIACFLEKDLSTVGFGVSITSIGVTEKARNKGVGSALIKQVFKFIKNDQRNVRYMSLHVLESNYSAIRLYEKSGFVKLFTEKGFYTISGKLYDSQVYCLFLNDTEDKECIKTSSLCLCM